MWNGIFKSYRVLRIIPVHEMTAADWRLLEYDNLRATAQNRIVETAQKGLSGFAWVNIYEKGKAKPNYLMPVTPIMVEELNRTGKFTFRNEAEEDLRENTVKFNGSVNSLGLTIAVYGTAAVVKYFRDRVEAEVPEVPESPPGTVLEVPEAIPGTVANLVEEFDKMVANGIEDFDELDAALAIALELVKYSYIMSKDTLVELEQFIDDADEALGLADDRGLL